MSDQGPKPLVPWLAVAHHRAMDVAACNHGIDKGHGRGVLEGLRPLHRDLRHAIPEVYKTGEFHEACFAAGALDVKTKELIALAIAVIERCDGCIASHTEGAARSGATLQEAADAIGVAFLMGGGPATIYGPRAFAAFKEFDTAPAVVA
jgi:AhpD family alkylhydroperoxidase